MSSSIVGPQHQWEPQSPRNASQPQGSESTPRIWKSSEASRQRGISRAKAGLLLLIIGLILGPIPYLMYLGVICAIVGAIMVILGQNRFDTRHIYIAISAAVTYIVGSGIIFFATAVFANSISVSGPVGSPGHGVLSLWLTDDLNGFLITDLIGSAVIGVASVLFTYALQDETGRLLLYVSFVLWLGLGVLAAYIVGGQVVSTVSEALRFVYYYDPTPVRSLQTQLQYLQLLLLIPAGLFAIAYYRAYSRIGEMFPRQ